VGEREQVSEDEGAQCEDEGVESDSEPDETSDGRGGYSMCNWADEGDQTRLAPVPVWSAPPVARPGGHQNVSGMIPVTQSQVGLRVQIIP
jgi:hypothetical protein